MIVPQLVEESSALGRRIDDVRRLWLEGEHDIVLPCDRQRLAERPDEVVPGIRQVVVRVPSPHALAVPRAGADRDHPWQVREGGLTPTFSLDFSQLTPYNITYDRYH